MLTNEEKVSYRRLEPAVQKFIKVAVPTDLGRLKNHQLNIEKYRRSKSWDLLHKEQINAGRTVQQLRSNILEMESLLRRVKTEDFVTLTKVLNPVRASATLAITDFLELQSKSTENVNSHSRRRSVIELQDSLTEAPEISNDNSCQISSAHSEIHQDQYVLESWAALEKDLLEVSTLVNEFSHCVHSQQEMIDNIEDNVNTAALNVEEGTKNLGEAAKYKLAMLPAAGAVIGGILGGPIGLMAGFKVVGIATALGGGILGFKGGKYFQRKKEDVIEDQISSTEDKTDT
uniref:t-SNARE coiled-coil homology domain-containing protein n=2 Tax=Leptobrachium leishanense TaxID=445787 RepID=A0A8C5WGG7_9ANUR